MSSQSPLALAVTIAELESHLWEAANILRGSSVDRTDWKSYILPAVLLQTQLRRLGRQARRDARRVRRGLRRRTQFPGAEDCHWSNVRRAPKNVGTALSKAMRGVEAANQKHLYQ